jgi:hypothetical protein
MVGHSIIIGSTPYTVVSVTPPDTMTVSTLCRNRRSRALELPPDRVTAPRRGPRLPLRSRADFFKCVSGPGLGNWSLLMLATMPPMGVCASTGRRSLTASVRSWRIRTSTPVDGRRLYIAQRTIRS